MMRKNLSRMALTALLAGPLLFSSGKAAAADFQDRFMAEQQLTVSPKNHDLDNNDNFSGDGRYLCYDTREMLGPGIDNSVSIELLELSTGREIVIYQPDHVMIGEKPAPGVGAVSFNPAAQEVAFIHGPLTEEVSRRGPYGKPNRSGGRITLGGDVVEVDGAWRMLKEGKYGFSWIDERDIEKSRPTLPGAHRGGTHRHEYTLSGKRIGFTYDDFLLPQYDRTIGYMEASPKAPAPASHWFAVLVAVAPIGKSKPGEIEKAYFDSWVGAEGLMRAFVGKTRDEDGVTYEESLYVVDIPADVDITTSDSGAADRYPAPPKGLRIRRLTHAWAAGVVRGTTDGRYIAYLGKDKEGGIQAFVIPSNGSDTAEDPALRPVQVTHLAQGTLSNLRWHPSGNTLFCISDDGIAAACVKAGPNFGKTVFLTPHGDGIKRHAMVVSPDGKHLAYNRLITTPGPDGKPFKTWANLDCKQIFMIDFPDNDGDGVIDGL